MREFFCSGTLKRTLHAVAFRAGPPILLCVTGFLVACGSSDSDDAGTGDPGAAATSTPVDGIYFLREEDAYEESPTAGLPGVIKVVDGCLWIDPALDEELVLLIWPAGYELDASGVHAAVLDRDGQVVAREGQEVVLGGGMMTEDPNDKAIRAWINDRLESPIPEHCRGPIWLVGVWPA